MNVELTEDMVSNRLKLILENNATVIELYLIDTYAGK